jgi:hypothetical protein
MTAATQDPKTYLECLEWLRDALLDLGTDSAKARAKMVAELIEQAKKGQ